MEEGAEVDVQESCKVCGMKRATLRAGFLYCVECGMRTADSQPILDFTMNVDKIAQSYKLSKHSGNKKKRGNDFSSMWSTWHAHNMILLGLVEEVSMCGAVGDTLSGVVLRLWSRWLRYNKIAFFCKTNNELPKLTLGFKPRDLNLLYGICKKRNRKPKSPTQHDSTEFDGRKKAVSTLNAYIKEEQKFLSSQMSDVPLASQNLEDIKLKVDDSKPKEITFNAFTQKMLKNKLSEEEYDLHIQKGYCSNECKCFKHPRNVFKNRKNRTSIFNLYVLLYLGIRINNDEIQLGDILRWCKEGHITYGTYKHFFPEDMTIKSTDKLRISPTMLTHKNVLLTASHFARMFGLAGIKAPDIGLLLKRYIDELELPHELFGIICKIIKYLPKLSDYYPKEDSLMPNYEAITLSYIIVSLKILFGLDGVSENKISNTAETCNDVFKLEKNYKSQILFNEHNEEDYKKSFRRLFVFKDWMKYIEYRKICLSQCHYPTKIKYQPNSEDDPELFLFHQNKMKRIQSDGIIRNECQAIIKSLLQRVEDNYSQDIEYQFPLFSCTLTPMASNTLDLLNWQYLNTEYTNFQVNKELLSEDFSLYNLSFLINPTQLKNMLHKEGYQLYTHSFSANSNLSVDPQFTKKTSLNYGIKLNDIVRVLDCDAHDWNGILLGEELSKELEEHKTELNYSIVSLSKINKKFSKQKCIKKKSKIGLDLHLCYENYWVRHYYNIKKKFTEKSFEEELELHFPKSFVWLLKECANIAEISTLALYYELSKIEQQINQISCGKENNKR